MEVACKQLLQGCHVLVWIGWWLAWLRGHAGCIVWHLGFCLLVVKTDIVQKEGLCMNAPEIMIILWKPMLQSRMKYQIRDWIRDWNWDSVIGADALDSGSSTHVAHVSSWRLIPNVRISAVFSVSPKSNFFFRFLIFFFLVWKGSWKNQWQCQWWTGPVAP